MRPLNFLLIFIVCILLVLFSLQNTELATIQVIKGVEVQAPLAIELIAATGVGALLAWLFSLLSQLQRILIARQTMRQIRQQELRIQDLEKDLQQIHQQGQRIQDLEGDVEKIHTAEKSVPPKTALTLVSSQNTDVKPALDSENHIEASQTDTTAEGTEKPANTDQEKVNAEA